LAPEDAYGERSDANIIAVPKEELQDFVDNGIALEVGSVLPTIM
jgi:FKBP-type peptidyl-prolyl cis-trans isomerase 2